jgi:hypothetical protein
MALRSSCGCARVKVVYVAIYVDYSLITGSGTKAIQHLRNHMVQTFGGTTGVINSFLNLHMKYEKHKGRIEMRQTYYRKKIFEDNNRSLVILSICPRSNQPIFGTDSALPSAYSTNMIK